MRWALVVSERGMTHEPAAACGLSGATAATARSVFSQHQRNFTKTRLAPRSQHCRMSREKSPPAALTGMSSSNPRITGYTALRAPFPWRRGRRLQLIARCRMG
jgi:hypothetical protein